MGISMKNLVEKDIAKTVRKHVEITPDMIGALIVKAVNAPEGTELKTGTVRVRDAEGNVVGEAQGYILDWTEQPKPRAPRKPKAEKTEGEQA